jgi:hypothetical protein
MQVVGISDAGRVAFTTEFLAGFDPLSGIYLTGTGGTTLVAFEDAATPVPGKFFRGFLNGGTTINDAGQVAFIADLSDSVNGASAGRGIFLYDPTGGLQQVARTGDPLNGSTITTVYFLGTVSGVGSTSPDTSLTGLNNVGQVAYGFTLANGTGGVAIWTNTAGVPGDYNNNGTVDAADYVVWRKGGPLANEVDDSDIVDGQDYTEWRLRFGNPSSGGGAEVTRGSLVPEPAMALSALGIAIAAISHRRRSRGSVF